MAAARAAEAGRSSVTAASSRPAATAAHARVGSGRDMAVGDDADNRDDDEQRKAGRPERNCRTHTRCARDQELLATRAELCRLAYRPDVRRRRLAEGSLVAFNSLLVLALELAALDSAASARLMVQLQPQGLAAQLLPVVPSVDQVQVPGLIDSVRRCHRMAGARGEI